MTRHLFIVSQLITVDLDESKFTPEFMQEFRDTMYSFETIDEHAEHLAQLHARGLYNFSLGRGFVEGYGNIEKFGIKVTGGLTDVEAVE